MLLLACTPASHNGSGTAAQQQRQTKPFSAIDIVGTYVLDITAGKSSHSVVLHGDDNLLEQVTTKSNGKRLMVRSEGRLSPKLPLRLQLDVPDIKLVRTAGAMTIAVSQLSNARFQLDCDGACTATAKGKTQKLKVYVKGSGRVKMAELFTNEALVTVQGSGQVDVHVGKHLEVLVQGSGKVRYRGKPKIDKTIRGAGQVVPR